MKRPYVRINLAMTADGKIDTFERKGAAISSEYDKQRVDKLRADADAVLVGGRTLLAEDPKLTVKSEALRAGRIQRGLPPNPAKVGIVTRATFKPDSNFLNAGPARIILFTTTQTDPAEIERLRARGVEVEIHTGKRVLLESMLLTLHSQKFERLLVEGGGTLNFEMLRLRLVDEITVYISPMIFGGSASPTLADGGGFSITSALPLRLDGIEKCVDGGVILRYHLK